MTNSISQLRKGTIEIAILALLNDADRYGGELIERLSTLNGLDAPAGTVYPLLKRLANGGLVSTSWKESPCGPPRKYYSITPSGQREFAELKRAWQTISKSLNTLMEV